jgi:protein-S-isoprenylcysteine O-methyltransferase Ste14
MLAILWTAFCVLHSALISVTFTDFIKPKLGDKYRYYRLLYNIFSIATLLPAVIYSLSIRQEPFFVWSGYFKPVQYLLILTGVLCFVMGARHYSLGQFSGLTQIKEGTGNKLINKTGKLSCRGILGVVRHPFYAGIYPLLWSSNLDVSVLIINIILSVYVFIGTLLEERKLILEFGDAYNQYRMRVSMLFPFLWIKKKIGFAAVQLS